MTPQQEKELALLTNTYFMLLEAADMILRNTEVYFEAIGVSMVGKHKVKHRNLMSQIQTLKVMMDNEIKFYCESYKNDYRKWDELRAGGAYFARLALEVGDRSYSEEDDDSVEKQIAKYVHDLPPKGMLSNQLLMNFFIR